MRQLRLSPWQHPFPIFNIMANGLTVTHEKASGTSSEQLDMSMSFEQPLKRITKQHCSYTVYLAQRRYRPLSCVPCPSLPNTASKMPK